MSRKILSKVLKRIVKNIGLHNIGYVITALIKNLMQSTLKKVGISSCGLLWRENLPKCGNYLVIINQLSTLSERRKFERSVNSISKMGLCFCKPGGWNIFKARLSFFACIWNRMFSRSQRQNCLKLAIIK